MNLRFVGEVIYWRGPALYYFVRVPALEAAAIQEVSRDLSYGWGCITITGMIGETEFSSALMPKDGGYLVPLRKAIREVEQLDDGDEVEVELHLG